MQKESIIENFKALLAEAMVLGGLSADIDYRGTIEDVDHKALVECMKSLYEKLDNFIIVGMLKGISALDILPLQTEIEALTKKPLTTMHTKEMIKDYLGSLISEAMYMEEGELQEDELFSDFGLESTTLVKILAKLSEKYSCSLTANELLSHQTLNAASEFIYGKVKEIQL